MQAREILDGKHGKDPVLMDVRGQQSGITDFFLIVTGTSPPHLKALFNEVQQGLKAKGVACFRKAGMPEGGWLVLDYVDLVIHILSPEAREYYDLESLWKTAPHLL